VLHRIAAATTRTMVSASAPSAEALVHGYASAAGLVGARQKNEITIGQLGDYAGGYQPVRHFLEHIFYPRVRDVK
jgi:hypothetical protein